MVKPIDGVDEHLAQEATANLAAEGAAQQETLHATHHELSGSLQSQMEELLAHARSELETYVQQAMHDLEQEKQHAIQEIEQQKTHALQEIEQHHQEALQAIQTAVHDGQTALSHDTDAHKHDMQVFVEQHEQEALRAIHEAEEHAKQALAAETENHKSGIQALVTTVSELIAPGPLGLVISGLAGPLVETLVQDAVNSHSNT